MRRSPLLLGLFIATVSIVAIYLVGRNGPDRVAAADTACPPATAPDYSRPFFPDHEIPYLCAAARMAPAQGVIYVLHRSIPVRTYIATEIVAECRTTQPSLCGAHLGDAALEAAIDSRLDALLPRSIKDSHDFTSADLSTRFLFSWSAFFALRSDKSPYAAISFETPRGTPFTLQRVEQQYGVAAQRETDPQGYISLEYLKLGTGYAARIAFLVDPVTTEVRRVMVSVIWQ